MYARPHPKNATPADALGPPKDFQLFQDKMWAVVLATADGSLVLSSAADGSDAQTFPVTAGVNKLQLPLVPGGSMHGTLTRAGATVIDLAATNFTFDPNPAAFNYNAFTISATSA